VCVNRVTEKVTFRLEICMGIGMVGIPQNLQEWVHLLWNTAGMEFIAAGNPQGVWKMCSHILLWSVDKPICGDRWGWKQNGAGTSGDGYKCLQESGWGWIQTARGRVGMGLKSCPHADL